MPAGRRVSIRARRTANGRRPERRAVGRRRLDSGPARRGAERTIANDGRLGVCGSTRALVVRSRHRERRGGDRAPRPTCQLGRCGSTLVDDVERVERLRSRTRRPSRGRRASTRPEVGSVRRSSWRRARCCSPCGLRALSARRLDRSSTTRGHARAARGRDRPPPARARDRAAGRSSAAEVLDERWTRPEPPARVEEALAGRRIEAVGRRGKYLILELDDGVVAGRCTCG